LTPASVALADLFIAFFFGMLSMMTYTPKPFCSIWNREVDHGITVSAKPPAQRGPAGLPKQTYRPLTACLDDETTFLCSFIE
jgi:hypothetical protein